MDHELIENCMRLDDAARNNTAALHAFYSDDFLIHRLDSSGETMVFDKPALISFLKSQSSRDTGPRGGTTVEYVHASQSGDTGMVVGKRTMQTTGKVVELIFTQIWQRSSDGWQMIRESVYAQAH